MRIIGGSLKGKIILPPPEFKARPTTDVAKEALFNILDNEFEFEGLNVHFIRIRITRSRTRLVGRNESAVFLIH